ncbi:efflux RND transporter periplasmic adaptor subunit [Cellvibrio sp. OA-2007]|uniref:efflux RND transporter periplasmic adaptor subunit n=1 Tax=Cellvibrio sp. OA-2007 TaxID=529823 RepID=UPI000781F886|nr:efflux RND transporter periplasmic adaptor subunit [Cellvibrio sp. OA-2007]
MTIFSFRQLPLIALGMLALGTLIGVLLGTHQAPSPSSIDTTSTDKTERQILYWYDPMVPNQHFDKPGKSPFMDMDLVPKYATTKTEGANQAAVRIKPALVQNLGMRTALVKLIAAQREWDVTGKLAFNERNQAVIQLRAAGFVSKVWPLAVGDKVTMGQPIATLDVPEWLGAQNELLAQPRENRRLLHTLRERLRLLGMPDSLIAQAEKTRLPITQVTINAPISGVITELSIKTGMALASGATLARINNIDSLWLDAAIPEAQTESLLAGARACFFATNPGAPVLHGTLEYLLPTVDQMSGTVTARILLDNPSSQLKPGTSGRVWLQSQNEEQALAVPTEAVIRTGKTTLVMLAEAGGAFRPVLVEAGHEVGDQTLIRSGLNEGDKVVVSGQFLLDSEASLLGITAQNQEMNPEMIHD